MKLKRLPQKLSPHKHMRKRPSQTTPSTREPLASNPLDYIIGYCWFLYHTGRLRRRLPTLPIQDITPRAQTLSRSRRLSRRWQRIISILGIHLQVGASSSHSHFNLPIPANSRLADVAQRVLIARVSDGIGVCPLNVALLQFAIYRAAPGGKHIFRQNVAVSHDCPCLWQVD